jgi:glycosyltransferase involved in cell wall biosynthesis
VTNATETLIRLKFPNVRYTLEPRPGLDWARNRAIVEAKGEIIAYTDDDVIVDKGWVKAFGILFAENPEVMASTGLVVPYELETEAQVLFEEYGGFGRGFKRKWTRVERGQKMPWQLLGTGQFGTGANMAYRLSVFDKIGLFDPALDVGTVTNGGGDLEMFFRVLREGYTLVYEPAAMVRHRHRRENEKLKTQITNNGSLYAYFIAGVTKYPDMRRTFLKIGIYWMRYWHFRRYIMSFFSPGGFPRDLILAELKGSFTGLTLYKKSVKKVKEIEKDFGAFPTLTIRESGNLTGRHEVRGIGVRMMELTENIQPITDVPQYTGVRVFIAYKGNPIGSVDIPNKGETISKSRFIEEVVNKLHLSLLLLKQEYNKDNVWTKLKDGLALKYHYDTEEKVESKAGNLPLNISASVVLCTYNRPDDLRNCLSSLTSQVSGRFYEIIVVDNCPSSGLTSPVVAEFPEVMLINETRQGLAYARNAGIIASRGDIIIATDDDVTMPPDWLEKIIAPFSRADIMCVTGNTLPVELATRSQQLFEEYGGLGKGFDPFEADRKWFNKFRYRAAPVWKLGATANAAFRASIFKDTRIGLMNEMLGAGMPSGCSEDSYMFYKILRAGYTLVYEPAAFVWHKHRGSMKALKNQIYNYSKGHICHHLATWIYDKDQRGLIQILFRLPQAHFYRIKSRLMGKSTYPISMILLEIKGNLAAPWALFRSWKRVKKQGRSTFQDHPLVIHKEPGVLL